MGSSAKETKGYTHMSETTFTPETDLKEARAMVNGLEEYLKGSDLYGKAGSGGLFSMSQMPSLTVGALLMRLRRLATLSESLTPAQREELAGIEMAHETVRRAWQGHYHAKMTREALSRLKAMHTFFEELRDSPRLAASSYMPEALRRTIAQELHTALKQDGQPTEEIEEAMRAADSRLRRWVRPSDFIWAPALSPAYDSKTFWWLYSSPQERAER
jgi:hypothetical protein